MTEQDGSPPEQVQAFFTIEGAPVYNFAAKGNLTLPFNLSPRTLVQVECPGRMGGIAHYVVEEPPEGGKKGVYLHALTPDELKSFEKGNPQHPTYKVEHEKAE